MLGLLPVPRCVQIPAVLRGPFALILHPLKLHQCMTMMKTLLHMVRRMCHTQKMERICYKVLCHCQTSSASDDEDAHKTIVCEARMEERHPIRYLVR